MALPAVASTSVSCTWTARTSIGAHSWEFVDISSDGTKIIAGAWADYIFTSSDGGVTWTQRTNAGSRAWEWVDVSDDGTRMIGYEQAYAGIWNSTNGGASWTQRGTYIPNAASSDGLKLLASNYYSPNSLYRSSDGGVSWTLISLPGYGLTPNPSTNYSSSAGDGLKMVSIHATNGYIYTTTDSGANWTQRTSAGSIGWYYVKYTRDASRIIAVANPNDGFYESTDGGATWTLRSGTSFPLGFRSIDFSNDGNRIIDVEDIHGYPRYVNVSGDGGQTWSRQDALGENMWTYVVMTPDGTKMVAVSNSSPGYLYTGICTYNQPPPAPTITGPNTGYSSVANTYTFSGANDPENDTIRYAIDWDNNGTVDAYAPTSGYAADNSSQDASYTWNTPGAKTFQARSEDSRGGVSGWTPYNVTIGDVPTVIVTASTTEYRGGDPVIGFTWSSSGAVSCTGTNLTTGGLTSGSITLTPTTTTTYTVTCTSPGGSDADSITVNFTANQPPNTPTITGPTTGRTGSTYTYTVTGSDPDGDAVRFGVDFNGDDIVDSWTNW